MAPDVKPLSSGTLVLDFCWERIQSQGTQIQQEVYLENHKGRRNKLQRQNKDPWNLGVRKAKKTCLGERQWGKCRCAPERKCLGKKRGEERCRWYSREKEQTGSFNLRAFICFPNTKALRKVQGEDVNRSQS